MPAGSEADGGALPAAWPRGPIRSEGRWLVDSRGRVVTIHGLFGAWKTPPFLPPNDPQAPDSLTPLDVARIRSLGFDGFRLAWLWAGMEPTPQGIDTTYLDRLAEVTSELSSAGIFVLLDNHQDLYAASFGGDGFPDWTVHTDGIPSPVSLGFPAEYLTPADSHAFDNLWLRRYGILEQLAGVWETVARRFAGDPGVLGYDLVNEPWPGSSWPSCAHPLGCPAFDRLLLQPDEELLAAAVRRGDASHLVFLEPHILFNLGVASWLGSAAPGIQPVGLSFHDQCLSRSLWYASAPLGAGTGQLLSSLGDAVCPVPDNHVLDDALATADRLGGPALMTEVAATSNDDVAGLACLLEQADRHLVGWTYGLSWRTGELRTLSPAKAAVLARTYPVAIAGTPREVAFDPTTGAFRLVYAADRRVRAPTVIEVPVAVHYPHGYVVRVRGARVTSPTDADLLTLANLPGASEVEVEVDPTEAPAAVPGSACPPISRVVPPLPALPPG